MLEVIAWRVADTLEVIRVSTAVDVLRVDGGNMRPPLLQLQADAGGTPVERGAVDATATAQRDSQPWSRAAAGERHRSPSHTDR